MSDEPRKPAPVVLRIKVRYEEPEAFVERFAPYVARAGLFLRSKQPKAVGTEVRFELRLANDQPVLVGMGIVRWAREPDRARPMQPPGMAIEFTRVTKESRGVILQMLELRRKLGLVDGPRGLPSPPDDDVAVTAAAQASATGADLAAAGAGAAAAAGPAAAAAAAAAADAAANAAAAAGAAAAAEWAAAAATATATATDTATATATDTATATATDTATDSATDSSAVPQAPFPPAPSAAVAAPMAPFPPAPSAAHVVMPAPTTPRPPANVAPLAPYEGRARRPAAADLVAQLAHSNAPPLADAFGEVEIAEADLSKTVSRARALAGHDADRELAQLLDEDAAPVAVTIDEASSKLASLLGTSPVVRRRGDDSVPERSRPAFSSVPKVAASISADFAQQPPQPPPGETTRVVDLNAYAAATAQPVEGPTRVVHLDSLVAETRDRDADERTQVRRLPGSPASHAPGPDDERTKVISAREVERAQTSGDDVDDTLDFDRRPAREIARDNDDDDDSSAGNVRAPHRAGDSQRANTRGDAVPRDFAEPDADVDTAVRHRHPTPARGAAQPVPTRPAPRTMPPPLPPQARARRSEPTMPPPAPPPPPSSNDDAPDLHVPPTRAQSSSGSIDLTDLVDELAAEAAQPVPLRDRELERSLGGDALDADGLIADIDSHERRASHPNLRDDDIPDLASFADPPSSGPSRAPRAESLDAALSSLEGDDDDRGEPGEERTSWARPASQPSRGGTGSGPRPGRPAPEGDDDVEIEIELDD